MKTMNHREITFSPVRLPRVVLVLVFSLLLASCGGGGVVPSVSVATTEKSRTQTQEWAEFISRKAVSYSPYRTNDRNAETPTYDHIAEDLRLLVMGDFRLIRLFNSSDKEGRLTLEVIRGEGLDVKVQLGAYLQGENNPFDSEATQQANREINKAEVERLISLANEFADIVLAVSVGNEAMVEWSLVKVDPESVASYIADVRSRVKQPVTTDDNSKWYASAPKVVIDAIDFASVHLYSELDTKYPAVSFDWRKTDAVSMMATFIENEKKLYNDVRSNLDLKGQAVMPIVIGESGWNSVDLGQLGYRAHPVNQKMFFLAMEKWARETKTTGGPANFFYFEAFDEPWKGDDDRFGLFTVARKARYVVQGLYPSSLWDVTYTDADAIHWLPISNKKITADRFTLFAEAFVLNEERPWWVANAWDGTATRAEVTNAAPPDGSVSTVITPRPRFWGWGIPFDLKESDLSTNTSYDMSDFTAGTINFSIKTTTPGIIEVGFVTGRFSDSSAKEVYMPIAPGEYGYMNDGAWHKVSVPVSVLLAKAGGPGFQGQTTNMKEVTTGLVIADRYAFTGKANNSNITTPIHIDAIYWAK